MTLHRSDPRVNFYLAVRDFLLACAASASVPTCVELGAGGGAGRAYLGENVAYLGLEQRPSHRAKNATLARGDWVRAWPYPTHHFDVAACFAPETRGPIGSVVFRAKQAVKEESGVVVFGWPKADTADPGTDRATGKAFASVTDVVFGRARVRVCTGPREIR